MTAETSPDALKPCPNPWCSSHDRSDVEIFAAHRPILMPAQRGDRWSVACPVCPLQTPYRATESEAITTWNTRTPAAPNAGELAKAIERLEDVMSPWVGALWAWDFDIADLRLIIAAAKERL